jgi:hypothetical protein
MEYTEKEILSQQNRIQTVADALRLQHGHCRKLPLPLLPPALAPRPRPRPRPRPPPLPLPPLSARMPCVRAPETASTGCPAQVKDNPEKDEHDVKKQEEVLAE